MTAARSSRPLAKLIKGAAECSAQATAYGKCVAINAQEIQKDMCANEFKAFKDCVQAATKRKW